MGWPLMAPADSMFWTSAPRKTAMYTETTTKTMNLVPQLNQRDGQIWAPSKLYSRSPLSNKAPGGYGLGTAATNIPDLNDATKNGWYMNGAGGEAVHAPDNVPGWLVLVCAYADEIVFQTAYRYGSAEGLISARRSHHYLFGGWQPWEWITPQMVPGIEYRTVKRDHDKVVYEKTVQTGALPAGGTKSIAHGVSDIGLRLTIRCAFDNDGNNLVGNPDCRDIGGPRQYYHHNDSGIQGPLMGTALLIHGYLSHTQKILFLGLPIFEFQSSCLISCLCVI